MPTKDAGAGGTGRRPTGSTGRNRNAFCSFCRKSYRDVGPLVEGPGDVYICGECIELCQSIIDQEKRRRGGSKSLFTHIPSPRNIKDKLDQYVIGQHHAKKHHKKHKRHAKHHGQNQQGQNENNQGSNGDSSAQNQYGTRPGKGCGDRNHVHTGPPGKGDTNRESCPK